MYRGGDLLEAFHGSLPEWLLILAAFVTRFGDVWVLVSMTILASWLLTWKNVSVGPARARDRTAGTSSTNSDTASTNSDTASTGNDTTSAEGGVVPSAVWLVGVVVGGLAAMTALKYTFLLPRPDLLAPTPALLPAALESTYISTVTVGGYAFPSGHAFGATVAYGALAMAIPWGARRTRFAVAGVAIVAISLSRVVLVVHYPGDIVAGMVVGVSYLAAVWWLLERSPVDRPTTAFATALGLALVAIAVSGGAGRSVTYAALAGGALVGWSIGRPDALGKRESTPRRAYHVGSGTLVLAILVGLTVVSDALTVAWAGALGAIVVAPAVVLPRRRTV
ncbi:phosphatase PAP2 family protein [Natronorubrum daqingense]|uniref:PAP2 superfamily protein n=1 Tax=Natronorubrum daqingense TaxID=588898 RepID=A0A1N7D765_9EURY|nr:phosphatase PAP2 family protein [Natronorubrum daqingense]APX97256.1 phosphoesterase [Natronorubrum daqingense]SIR71700.1 PAP2 superfamily protein [Natronorubrum daqingense]